jgi:hypothetical protein
MHRLVRETTQLMADLPLRALQSRWSNPPACLLYVKLILLLAGVFALRPAVFGQRWTEAGLIMLALAFALHLLEIRGRPQLTRQITITVLSGSMLWLFLLLQALLNKVEHLNWAIKAVIAHLVVIPIAGLMLSHRPTNRRFFRGFILVMLVPVVSYWITWALSLLVPIDRLFLFRIDQGYPGNAGDTYLPLTPVYGFVSSLRIPRLLGWFRESGIFQAFLLWAYVSLPSFDLDRRWIRLLLLLGVVACLSTTGAVLLPLTVALAYLISGRHRRSRRLAITALLLVTATVVALYAPVVGLRAKSAAMPHSITDRVESTRHGLERLADHPLGVGIYNSSAPMAGINLIASTFFIGLIGLVLVLLTWFGPALAAPDPRRYLVAVMPLFLTFLLAQPLLDAPLMYIMLMAEQRTPADGRPGAVTGEGAAAAVRPPAARTRAGPDAGGPGPASSAGRAGRAAWPRRGR